jgi:hypothetical protein
MILKLQQLGLITRQPGVARSITLTVDPKALPELDSGDDQPVKITVQRYWYIVSMKPAGCERLLSASVCGPKVHSRMVGRHGSPSAGDGYLDRRRRPGAVGDDRAVADGTGKLGSARPHHFGVSR